ncbi:MAG: hypothetical protein AABX17_02845 [Nanoarchaeota archaeon]
METQTKVNAIDLERILLDVDLTSEILNRARLILRTGKEPKLVAQKIAAGILSDKGDYLKALPIYESFGEVPEEIIRKNQLLYLGLVDKPEYLKKFRELVLKYGKRFSEEDVKEKFVRELQDVHSCFLTGPANVKNHQSLVKLIEEETGVKFDRSLIRKAYIDAIRGGYGHCVENVFSNSKCESFKPKTREEYEAVYRLIEKNVRADSLATPQYVHNIPIITGVSPSYGLLLQVGRKKAQEVLAKKMHPDYMKEYAESVRAIGLPVLAEHLYKISKIKYTEEKPVESMKPQTTSFFQELCTDVKNISLSLRGKK